ncbi:MAG: O-antigen ligase family protein [Anaerolineae bacterium]
MTPLRTARSWLAQHPPLWQTALIAGALATALALALLPISKLFLALGLVGLGMLAAGTWLARHSRLPVEWAFLAFVFLMPATRFSLLEMGFSFQANYAALAATAFYLLCRTLACALPLWWPRSRVHTAILLLTLVIAASFFLSAQVPPGEYRGEVRYIRSAKQIAQFLLMVAAYAVGVLVVQDRRLFRRAVGILILSTLAVSLYGIYQFIAYSLGWPGVDLFPQSASFGASRQWAIPLAGGRFLRIWSVASEPVWFGDFLSGVIPLVFALLAGRALQGGRWQWLLWVTLGAAGLALLLTFARSAYLAVLAGGIVVLAFAPRFLARAGIALAGVVIVIAVISIILSQMPVTEQASLLQAVSDRFVSPFQEENFGNIHRTTAIAASWAMFLDRPWGVGYGNYGFFFYDYMPAWGRAITDADPDAFPVMSGSIILRFLTETGIPGLLAFVWLIIAVTLEGLDAIRGWRRRGDRFMRIATLGLLAGFLALMTRLTMADSIHFTYQWFFIAIIVASARLARRSSPDPASHEVA